VKHELTDAQIEQLAVISPYATGATIKDTVNEALVFAIRDGTRHDHVARRAQGQAPQDPRCPR
jgi:aspartate carbamoyltransferase regulatory subunit